MALDIQTRINIGRSRLWPTCAAGFSNALDIAPASPGAGRTAKTPAGCTVATVVATAAAVVFRRGEAMKGRLMSPAKRAGPSVPVGVRSRAKGRSPMASVKQHKSTALTILVIALVLILGVGFVVDPDSTAGDRTIGIVLLVAGATSGVGLWRLTTKRPTVGASQMLIVIGPIAAGALAISAMVEDFGFFVWVFGPLLVLALLALWLGVINRGLQTELGQPSLS